MAHWYKRDVQGALANMAGMSLVDRGAFNSIVDVFVDRNGEVPNDDRLISKIISCDIREWRGCKARLMAAGHIIVDDGKLIVRQYNEGVRRALPKPQLSDSYGLAKPQLSVKVDKKPNDFYAGGRALEYKKDYRLQTTDYRKKEVDSMKAGDSPAPPFQEPPPQSTGEHDFVSDDGEVTFTAPEIEKLVDRFPFIRVRPQLRHLTRDWPDVVGDPRRKQKIISALETKNAKARDKQTAEAKGRKYDKDRAPGRLANPDYVPGETDEFGRKPLWERMQSGEFSRNARRH